MTTTGAPPSDRARDPIVLLKHGSGGRAMRRLIAEILTDGFADAPLEGIGLAAMDDGAAFRIGDQWLVITTDAHVVQPAFFPGGDIGRLAVAGTVNDLAMMGATRPLGLASAVVIEEGFRESDLRRIQASMREACGEAGVTIVTGDTKVMGRGELDGIVITTTGIALTSRVVPDAGLAPGDAILLTGTMGDHGIALMARRHELEFEVELRSDVAPLNGLIAAALDARPGAVVAMKDPTRGGVASALHEMSGKSRVGIEIDEPRVPVRPAVRSAAEMLGLDPFHIANEGKALLGVRGGDDAVAAVLAALRSHPLGADASVIGRSVAGEPGRVVLDTGLGRRLLVEPEGVPLPRIC